MHPTKEQISIRGCKILWEQSQEGASGSTIPPQLPPHGKAGFAWDLPGGSGPPLPAGMVETQLEHLTESMVYIGKTWCVRCPFSLQRGGGKQACEPGL